VEPERRAVDAAIKIIKDLGFPIFVCVYMLWIHNGTLREIRDYMKETVASLQRMEARK
jgi:hypothetical protein